MQCEEENIKVAATLPAVWHLWKMTKLKKIREIVAESETLRPKDNVGRIFCEDCD
jgi:hypothetical protein